MTPPTLPTLYTDSLSVSQLLTQAVARWRSSTTNDQNRFWSTPARPHGDPTREVLEVDLGQARLVNYVAFQTARFPHVVTAEFTEDGATWEPFTQRWLAGEGWWRGVSPSERANSVGSDNVNFSVHDSVPVMVQSSSPYSYAHPQHQGDGHWMKVAWKTAPVNARKVRLVLSRMSEGVPPADTLGRAADYSLGVRNFEVGYRVASRSDVPRYGNLTSGDPGFSSSQDILGNRVVYSLRSQPEKNILDGNLSTAWRCDTQPVNYSVVNLYVDVRNETGEAQVVDSFYIDALTTGPILNLYYAKDNPDSSAQASDEKLTSYLQGPIDVTPTTPEAFFPDDIAFPANNPTYMDISNTDLGLDSKSPWWVGISARSSTWRDGTSPNNNTPYVGKRHQWLAFSDNSLVYDDGVITFTSAGGSKVSIEVPEDHSIGSLFSVVIGYKPGRIHMTYKLAGHEPVTAEASILVETISPVDLFRVGDSSNSPALRIRGLALKREQLNDNIEQTFLSTPEPFFCKGAFNEDDLHLTDSALLRMHPTFTCPDNLPGVVGGPVDRYDNVVWSPIQGDYTLRTGYLKLPPTKATLWKFEFTGLVAEQIESFVPITRTIKLFPPAVVQRWENAMASKSDNPHDAGSGVTTMLDLANAARYSDAIRVVQDLSNPSATGHTSTEMLVATNPTQMKALDGLGWVWSYMPWHSGATAPRFTEVGQHAYEEVTLEHSTKVGFYVGIKDLKAYRSDYLANDDVEEYFENFHDSTHVRSASGVSWLGNQIVSEGVTGEVVSHVFNSRTPIRALQFATYESDAVQVLPDEDFSSPSLSDNWSVWGDAQLVRDPSTHQVAVTRAWVQMTYGMLEGLGGYGVMEGMLYGALEGHAATDGSGGGGIASKPFTPGDSGRVYGAARISSPTGTTIPVKVQLVHSQTGVVMATAERTLAPGETASFYCSLTLGSVRVASKYRALEPPNYASYGAIDGTYADHETHPILGDVYVRVVQTESSSDRFFVERVSVFDAPVGWDFSVDGGATWYEALDIRNDPFGVLRFPEPGAKLQWRMRIFRAGASVSGLAIRPWYLGEPGAATGWHSMLQTGPNASPADHYPDIERHPMWRQWSKPVPRSWFGVTTT